MRKVLSIFALALSFAACSDQEDGNDKTYGTGEMDPAATVTTPDTGTTTTATISDTSSANTQR